jgi:hypothetical protein
MDQFNFSNNKSKEESKNSYELNNDLPDKDNLLGQDLYKRDLTGLKAYFNDRPNIGRIFEELTYAIRNGYSVKRYLYDANLMKDEEIRAILIIGFSDVSSFLKDMLNIKENGELRRDYEALKEAINILGSS